MPEKLAVIGASGALILPWVVLALRCFGEYALFDRLLIGILGGIAATISLGYVLATAGGLDLYWVVYIAIFTLGLWAFIGRKSTDPDPAGERRSIWIFAALTPILVAEAIPTFSTDFPLGWDPSFHSILARKILLANALAEDWRPFEEIPVNYTQGLHVLIAILARWSGEPVHLVFQHLHLVIQPLAALLVGRLSMVVFGAPRMAALSMLVYALLCNFGSFKSYYQWGGMPTQIGSLFFLAIVWISMTGRGTKSTALSVLLFGSLILTHHLSALISTSVMAFYVALTFLVRANGELRGKFVRLFFLTILAYAFHIFPYGSRVIELGSTDALRFYDDPLKTGLELVGDLGYAAAILGFAGLALSLRRLENTREEFLLCWITALVLGFCLLGYVYRLGAHLFFGEEFTAFTPSRFFTVISYPLAIYAGSGLCAALAAIRSLVGKHLRISLHPDLAFAAALVTLTLSAVPDLRYLASLRSVSPQAFALGRSIEEQIPEGGFVLYDAKAMDALGSVEWVPYLTWRATIYTPIPASEHRQVFRDKLREFQSRDPHEVQRWLVAKGLRGYFVSQKNGQPFLIQQIKTEQQ